MSDAIQKYINSNKQGLILSLMQKRFEEEVMEYLDKGKYNSMEELDQWLDPKMREYDQLCDYVREWYAPKVEEEQNRDSDYED